MREVLVMDYRALLVKYMACVLECEGVALIGDGFALSLEEEDELYTIKKEAIDLLNAED